ncbi:acyl carrier protein [Streptomyces sp. NPDC090106]|uniref:acyl carrier protein n=1 Tax=Streptomyces sp. NPDC090106 TaxID=3365946 RepID=UPI0037F6A608
MNHTTTPLFVRPPAPSALRALDHDARTRTIAAWLCRELAHALDVPPAHRVGQDRPLHALGVDSLLALCLKRHLEDGLGVRIKAHDLLRDDTAAEIAALLADLIAEPTYGRAR